jgi:regulator of sigma E protease
MLQTIGIFFLFLTPLIFFHELGHFFLARLFGVRVEVFSIGFGPKLFKWKKNFTEYAWSLIPLGGYVKMFGDDPFKKDEIPTELREYSFSHQGKWARFWIVFGGPLANFLLAYVIFFFLVLSGEKIPELRFGVIPEKSTFYEKGLRTGDALRKVNGHEVWGPTDLLIDEKTDIQTVSINRLGEIKDIQLGMSSKEFFETFINYPPMFRIPLVVDNHGHYFGVSLDSTGVNWNRSLDEMANGITGPLFLHPLEIKGDIDLQNPPPINKDTKKIQKLSIQFSTPTQFFTQLTRKGHWPTDLIVRGVNPRSPADNAGLKPGDLIVCLHGKSLSGFEQLRQDLQNIKEPEVEVQFWRDGELKKVKLRPELRKQDKKEVKLIGVYSNAQHLPSTFVVIRPQGIGKALTKGFSRAWNSVTQTVVGLKKLITAEISYKNIGGPITIGKVASDSFRVGLSTFFQIMALISVNLAIINLFPIPILDGGHILFILIEIINRRPLSRRKMEIAQQFGLSFLLLLMLAALFNDFTRL